MASAEVLLFPNPTENELTINCNSEVEEITALDITGKLITLPIEKVGNSAFMKTEHLTSGMYFCHIKTSKGEKLTKFSKL